MKKTPNSALGRMSPEAFRNAPKKPVIVVLDNVRSAMNTGSVFRTADAFLIEGIYLCGITATPPDREINKTALGATETVSWKHYKTGLEAVSELKRDGWNVYCIEQAEGALTLDTFSISSEKNAFVFGHELKGVDQEIINISDGCIEIPQSGTKHSLNIAVCAGIVLWEVCRKIRT